MSQSKPQTKGSTFIADYSEEEIKKAHEVLYNEGLRMRVQVAGEAYVRKAIDNASDFSKPMQEFVAEACWGWVWTRPGLDLKIRSFLNIAMLCSQNRATELATHVKGALTNGASEEEIREVILHATAYCGMPAGIEGFRVAGKAIAEWNEERHRSGHRVENDSDVGVDVRMNTEDI